MPSDREHDRLTRRHFVAMPLLFALSGARLPALLMDPERFGRRRCSTEHPDPRPGITAEHVLPASRFPDKPRVAKAYDMAREIPEVLDGLYCHCDCSESMGHRSLLTCFESEQPAGCWLCGEEMRLAHKLHGEGKSLEEIRRAVDERWG